MDDFLPDTVGLLRRHPGPQFGVWAADTTRYDLELEFGATWQEKNKVQIPNDNQGDRFELTDIAESGPWASARVNAVWNVSGRHDVRLVLAPFSYEERGSFDQDVRFAGETFREGSPVSAKYTLIAGASAQVIGGWKAARIPTMFTISPGSIPDSSLRNTASEYLEHVS